MSLLVKKSLNKLKFRIEEERESGFYREDGFPKDTEDRPAINPDFAPDESCDFKWELKCIPGSEQSCFELEGYNNFEGNVCTPIGCPEGYHDIFDDEDNICHSNEKDCPNNMVLAEKEFGMQCMYLVDKPEIVEPTPTETGSKCLDGYQRTDDGEKCELKDVQCDETPDNSLCNGERGREGLIFCDVLYQETGGKGEGCYDRNDNPEQYCLMHPGDPWDFCTKENICDQDGSVKPDDEYCKAN